MSPEEAFGLALQKFRIKRGLSQEQLGFESGLHRTYISLLERGLKSPSIKTVFAIATALKVKPSKLLTKVESLIKL